MLFQKMLQILLSEEASNVVFNNEFLEFDVDFCLIKVINIRVSDGLLIYFDLL